MSLLYNYKYIYGIVLYLQTLTNTFMALIYIYYHVYGIALYLLAERAQSAITLVPMRCLLLFTLPLSWC